MSESPGDGAPSPSGMTEQAARRTGIWAGPVPAILIAFAAVALAAWLWYDARSETTALRREVAQRLAGAAAHADESRSLAGQMREVMAEAQARLGALEKRLAESQTQQTALDTLYQELSRSRDEWAYAEVEQALALASQQLQLAGNVKAALAALQAADARLQRLDRPQVIALRKALNRDIERLKSFPQVDAVAISVRLDSLIAQVDGLPLMAEARPQPQQPPAAAQQPEPGAWTRFWRAAWEELKQLVRVQRVDKPDVALLVPSHAYFLRENLKLRLIGARLALLARDTKSYKSDLKAARDWVGRYFDTRNSGVANALAVLRGLHEAEVGGEPPDIGASLDAMRSLRVARERAGR